MLLRYRGMFNAVLAALFLALSDARNLAVSLDEARFERLLEEILPAESPELFLPTETPDTVVEVPRSLPTQPIRPIDPSGGAGDGVLGEFFPPQEIEPPPLAYHADTLKIADLPRFRNITTSEDPDENSTSDEESSEDDADFVNIDFPIPSSPNDTSTLSPSTSTSGSSEEQLPVTEAPATTISEIHSTSNNASFEEGLPTTEVPATTKSEIPDVPLSVGNGTTSDFQTNATSRISPPGDPIAINSTVEAPTEEDDEEPIESTVELIVESTTDAPVLKPDFTPGLKATKSWITLGNLSDLQRVVERIDARLEVRSNQPQEILTRHDDSSLVFAPLFALNSSGEDGKLKPIPVSGLYTNSFEFLDYEEEESVLFTSAVEDDDSVTIVDLATNNTLQNSIGTLRTVGAVLSADFVQRGSIRLRRIGISTTCSSAILTDTDTGIEQRWFYSLLRSEPVAELLRFPFVRNSTSAPVGCFGGEGKVFNDHAEGSQRLWGLSEAADGPTSLGPVQEADLSEDNSFAPMFPDELEKLLQHADLQLASESRKSVRTRLEILTDRFHEQFNKYNNSGLVFLAIVVVVASLVLAIFADGTSKSQKVIIAFWTFFVFTFLAVVLHCLSFSYQPVFRISGKLSYNGKFALSEEPQKEIKFQTIERFVYTAHYLSRPTQLIITVALAALATAITAVSISLRVLYPKTDDSARNDTGEDRDENIREGDHAENSPVGSIFQQVWFEGADSNNFVSSTDDTGIRIDPDALVEDADTNNSRDDTGIRIDPDALAEDAYTDNSTDDTVIRGDPDAPAEYVDTNNSTDDTWETIDRTSQTEDAEMTQDNRDEDASRGQGRNSADRDGRTEDEVHEGPRR